MVVADVVPNEVHVDEVLADNTLKRQLSELKLIKGRNGHKGVGLSFSFI